MSEDTLPFDITNSIPVPLDPLDRRPMQSRQDTDQALLRVISDQLTSISGRLDRLESQYKSIHNDIRDMKGIIKQIGVMEGGGSSKKIVSRQ